MVPEETDATAVATSGGEDPGRSRQPQTGCDAVTRRVRQRSAPRHHRIGEFCRATVSSSASTPSRAWACSAGRSGDEDRFPFGDATSAAGRKAPHIYCNRELLERRAVMVGWMNVIDAQQYGSYNYTLRPDAGRFECAATTSPAAGLRASPTCFARSERAVASACAS